MITLHWPRERSMWMGTGSPFNPNCIWRISTEFCSVARGSPDSTSNCGHKVMLVLLSGSNIFVDVVRIGILPTVAIAILIQIKSHFDYLYYYKNNNVGKVFMSHFLYICYMTIKKKNSGFVFVKSVLVLNGESYQDGTAFLNACLQYSCNLFF